MVKQKFIKFKKTKKNYIREDKKITKKDLNRLKALYIPPAYKTIYLSKNENNKVQLIAEDKAGRHQYFYKPDYISRSDNRKYKALKSLVNIAENIETDNNTAINKIYNKFRNNTNNNKTILLNNNELINIIIWLLINCNFRIGNLKYDKLYNSTGITTLKGKHLKPVMMQKNSMDENIEVRFIGKKGVINNSIIDNKKIIFILNKIKNNNNNNYLFMKEDNSSLITSNDITKYFNEKYNNVNITPKMFRTYYANYHMLNYVFNHFQKDKEDFIKLTDKRKKSYIKKKIANYVSNKLHNTPNICLKKYINYKLLEKISNNINNMIKKKDNIHIVLKKFIG